MLVIASARLNIEQAVIYQTCENTNRCSHLIPQEGCLSMVGFKRRVFSWLPNNKYYKVGVKSLNQKIKDIIYPLCVKSCWCKTNTNLGSWFRGSLSF